MKTHSSGRARASRCRRLPCRSRSPGRPERLRRSTGVFAQQAAVPFRRGAGRVLSGWVGVSRLWAFRIRGRASPASFAGAKCLARSDIRSGSSMAPRTVSTITNVADLRELLRWPITGFGRQVACSISEARVRSRTKRSSCAPLRNVEPAVLHVLPPGQPAPGTPSGSAVRCIRRDVLLWHKRGRARVGARVHLLDRRLLPRRNPTRTPQGVRRDRRDCVNVVHISPAVSGNSYAPRSTGGDAQTVTMRDLTPAMGK